MPSGKRGRFPVGTPVLDAARSLGVYVRSVCGGRAHGRCQIEVQKGNFAKHKITSSLDHASPKAPRKSAMSACARRCRTDAGFPARPPSRGDLVIDVPQDTVINAQVVRKAATDRVIERNSPIQLCYVEVEQPDMHKPLGDLDRLKAALGKDWDSRICWLHLTSFQNSRRSCVPSCRTSRR
jgi:uncharacterized 2Fe-2S/4Fe-4S cluster protein (DUF4445 family)